MPLYEYECPNCSAHFEILASWSAADQQRCPDCDTPARRLLSVFATSGQCAPSSGGG